MPATPKLQFMLGRSIFPLSPLPETSPGIAAQTEFDYGDFSPRRLHLLSSKKRAEAPPPLLSAREKDAAAWAVRQQGVQQRGQQARERRTKRERDEEATQRQTTFVGDNEHESDHTPAKTDALLVQQIRAFSPPAGASTQQKENSSLNNNTSTTSTTSTMSTLTTVTAVMAAVGGIPPPQNYTRNKLDLHMQQTEKHFPVVGLNRHVHVQEVQMLMDRFGGVRSFRNMKRGVKKYAVIVVPDRKNPYDENALEVYVNGCFVGFVPAKINQRVNRFNNFAIRTFTQYGAQQFTMVVVETEAAAPPPKQHRRFQ